MIYNKLHMFEAYNLISNDVISIDPLNSRYNQDNASSPPKVFLHLYLLSVTIDLLAFLKI